MSAGSRVRMGLVALAVVVAGCGGSGDAGSATSAAEGGGAAIAPATTSSPTASTTSMAPTTTAAPDPLFVHAGAVRFVSYNIEFGASDTPGEIDGRLVNILDTLKRYNPDIVALQELHGWTRGTPPLIERVAAELGMNYTYCDTPTVIPGDPDDFSFDTAVLTRFEIADSASLTPEWAAERAPSFAPFLVEDIDIGITRLWDCLAVADIVMPGGSTLLVGSWHAVPTNDFADPTLPDGQKGCSSWELFVAAMSGYEEVPMVVMGDFNVPKPGFSGTQLSPISKQCGNLLGESAWQFITGRDSTAIDHMWASPATPDFEWTLGPFTNPYSDPLAGIELTGPGLGSDHFPLVVDVTWPGA